jgi:arylsulfatase A-like enzyme
VTVPGFATRALVLALVAAVPYTWLRASPYAALRDVLLPLTASCLLTTLWVAPLFLLAWLVLFELLRRALSPALSARLAAAVALAAPAAWFALQVNRNVLPDLMEPRSLIGNGVLLAALALAWELVSRALLAWRTKGEARSRPRARWVALTGAAVVAALVLAAGRLPQRDPGPDVLFILIDVARADHLGCYGYERPTSPNIDRLAEDAILFENAISPSTYTKTSVASLFTGLNAHRHGVYLGTFGKDAETVESDVLMDDFTTLAEAMFALGLNTAAWVQNGQLRGFLGYAQGFSLFHDQPGYVDTITEQYVDWHDEWSARLRSFTYLHVIDLHAPYKPPPPFLGTFEPPDEISPRMSHGSWYDFKEQVLAGEVVLTEAEVDGFEARYDELIMVVDHWIGRIVEHLKASGRYDDTLIVITGDHGEGFWEHGFISHSTTPFEELVHVPLIVKLPRSAGAGARVVRMVGVVDLMPTLLELVGGPVPEGLDGQSFLPLLLDPEREVDPRWLYMEVWGIVGVRTERWKYIQRPGQDPELYDLSADPGELTNCIADHADVAEQLAAAVSRAAEIRASGRAAERVVLDEDTVESLEALGYL